MIEWTDGRVKSFITSVIRRGWSKWPPKFRVLKEACVGRKVNKKSGKLALHYKCAMCNKQFPQTDIQVDHIDPVVAVTGFVDWNTFISRLFCKESNLQVLCKPCHSKKSKEETSMRKTSGNK